MYAWYGLFQVDHLCQLHRSGHKKTWGHNWCWTQPCQVSYFVDYSIPINFNLALDSFLLSLFICRLLGNLVLNLWDCGGQEAFMENYFASQRDNIFRNVEVGSCHLVSCHDLSMRKRCWSTCLMWRVGSWRRTCIITSLVLRRFYR